MQPSSTRNVGSSACSPNKSITRRSAMKPTCRADDFPVVLLFPARRRGLLGNFRFSMAAEVLHPCLATTPAQPLRRLVLTVVSRKVVLHRTQFCRGVLAFWSLGHGSQFLCGTDQSLLTAMN